MTRVSVKRTLSRLYWLLALVLLLLLAAKFADDMPGLPPLVVSIANKFYEFMRDMSMLIFNLLPAFPLDGGRIYCDLLATVLAHVTAVRIIAGLGVIVGLWSALAGLRVDVVLLLIGAEIAIMNWAIWKKPEEAPS